MCVCMCVCSSHPITTVSLPHSRAVAKKAPLRSEHHALSSKTGRQKRQNLLPAFNGREGSARNTWLGPDRGEVAVVQRLCARGAAHVRGHASWCTTPES